MKTMSQRKKTLKNKLDKLWSRAVRLAGNDTCQICGKWGNNPHHLIHKSAGNRFRWVFENGVCLCSGCHTMNQAEAAHGGGLVFADNMRKMKPEQSAWYDVAFGQNKMYGPKQHTLDELEELQAILEDKIREYE